MCERGWAIVNVDGDEEEEEEEEDDDDDDDDFDDVIYVLDSDGDDDDDGVRHNEHGNGSLFSIQSERSVLLDSEDSTDSETPDYPDRFKLQHGREVGLHILLFFCRPDESLFYLM